MIVATKYSKLDKVNNAFFRVISVSAKETQPEGTWNMDILLPPADLFLSRKNGEIGKKKFEKKYKKFLSAKNTIVENTIFSIGNSLKKKNSICFTCSDDEFDIGYLKILTEYISEVFGVEVVSLKDANEHIKYAFDSLELTKKEKKLVKMEDEKEIEELSDKKKAFRDKLIRKIDKEVSSDLSYEGDTYLSELDKKYAVDQVALKIVSEGIAKLTKSGEFKDIDASKLGKSSPLVQAILTTYESDKTLKGIIKEVVESHDLKVKEKKLKKLDKNSIIGLIGEIYTKLSIYRSEFHKDE